MFQLLIGTDIPFMKHRRLAYLFSGLLVAVTAVWMVAKGPRYSVDFTGGSLVQIRTVPAVPADRLRHALDLEGVAVELQQMTGANQDEYVLRFRTDKDPVAVVQAAVDKHLP